MRILVAALVGSLFLVAGLMAHRDRTAPIWVLTVFDAAGQSLVSDSFTQERRAIRAAQRITRPDIWVVVSRSLLHQSPGRPMFGVAALYAQTGLTVESAVVLPETDRDGTFESPELTLPATVAEAGITIQLPVAAAADPLTAFVAAIEQSNGDGTWRQRCAVGSEGAFNPSTPPYVQCQNADTWGTQPIRATFKTCYAVPYTADCTTRSTVIGATVEFAVR